MIVIESEVRKKRKSDVKCKKRVHWHDLEDIMLYYIILHYMFSLLDTVNVFTVAVVKDIECQCLPRVNDKPCTTAWGETFGSGGETLCLPQEAKGGFYRCGPLCLLYYHPSCVYS